jgi:hypothetical protein
VIPEIARSLGLDPAKALKDSYSMLARKHVAEQGKAVRKKAAQAAPAPA